MKKSRALVLSGLLLFLLAGCARAIDLKGLSANRFATAEYIKAQEEGFVKLKDDILKGRLQKGMAKEEVIAEYAPPIFCESGPGEGGVKESCLYRLPLQYFNTDLIYLFFDQGSRLLYWQLKGESIGKVNQ